MVYADARSQRSAAQHTNSDDCCFDGVHSWIAPFVEEYYFRGYLLPRLARFGNLAPVINAVLFSLYHFFTPWQALTRIIALVPMAWIVQRKRNLYISVIAHMVLNTLSLLPGLLVLLAK